jgi:hypothetical protein
MLTLLLLLAAGCQVNPFFIGVFSVLQGIPKALDTWNVCCLISVLRKWLLEPGTWYEVPGTRCLVRHTWYEVPGTSYTCISSGKFSIRRLIMNLWRNSDDYKLLISERCDSDNYILGFSKLAYTSCT